MVLDWSVDFTFKHWNRAPSLQKHRLLEFCDWESCWCCSEKEAIAEKEKEKDKQRRAMTYEGREMSICVHICPTQVTWSNEEKTLVWTCWQKPKASHMLSYHFYNLCLVSSEHCCTFSGRCEVKSEPISVGGILGKIRGKAFISLSFLFFYTFSLPTSKVCNVWFTVVAQTRDNWSQFSFSPNPTLQRLSRSLLSKHPNQPLPVVHMGQTQHHK